MNNEEKTVQSESVYKGKILNLKRDEVLLPNGKTSYREIIEHGGGSCILCVIENKIVFVRQYRYAYKSELLELPAGKIDSGEPPDKTAKRELEEECGIKAETVKKLFEIYPSPGYTNEKIYIYKAENISVGRVHLDEDEFVSSVMIDEQTVEKMLFDGEFKDAKTVIALQYYFLQKGKTGDL